ncbi:MAG TPA: cation:proton antiporter [Kineosporiaceae bacterium]
MSSTEINARIMLSVALVILTVRLLSAVFARIRQPPVMGEIVGGILLGPSVLGLVAPAVESYVFPDPVTDRLRTLAQFGLVLFMFLVGLNLERGLLSGSGRTVAAVTAASAVVPFCLGVGFAVAVRPQFGGRAGPVPFTLFLGVAMAVTALPVLARILEDSGLLRERVGVLCLTSAAVNDVAAWNVVAIVLTIAGAAGTPLGLWGSAVCAPLFVVVMMLVVRPALRRWAEPPVWAVVVITVVSAWVGEQVGVHAVFSGFLAGVVMPRDGQRSQWLSERLGPLVTAFLLPVFFAVVGLQMHADTLGAAGLVLFGAATAVAVCGKLGGAALAARAAGEEWRDALTIGVLLNTRGITEIIILSTGLQLRIISPTAFTVMVLVALVTTMMAAPALAVLRRPSVAAAADPPLPQTCPQVIDPEASGRR